MIFKETTISQIAQHMADDDYDILRLSDAYFPLAENFKKVSDIFKTYKLKIKDGYSDYKAIGLQYEDDENPFYDAVDLIAHININGKIEKKNNIRRKFLKKNEIGVQFEDIFNLFEPIMWLIRGRILVSEPGNKIVEHTDGLCSATLHYVVQTSPKAKVVVSQNEYHLPADGHFYVLNVSRPHYVSNMSDVDRIHITFPLNPGCIKSLSDEQRAKMEIFYGQFQSY